MALEEYIKQVKETWTNYTLDLVNYQNKCRLIRGWDDLFNKCSENLNSLVAMKLSPYYKVFDEEVLPPMTLPCRALTYYLGWSMGGEAQPHPCAVW